MSKWDQANQALQKEKPKVKKVNSRELVTSKNLQKKVQQKKEKIISDKPLTGHVFTKNQNLFLHALRENLAVLSKAAHASNLHRNNHFNWLKKSPEYKEEYESILDECLDFAENALLEQISDKDTTAIIFYLKCKGKKRGYVERTETEVTATIMPPMISLLPLNDKA